MKTFTSFSDKNGNSYGFDNYMEFSEWFFGTSRRVMMTIFDAATFKSLERAATQSADARKKM